MADVMTPAQRSRVMSKNQGKHTSPERRIAELLDVAGLTYVQHEPSLAGKPDFVFHDSRLAVFVDGDFWHGWRFPLWQHRLADFWREKISRNRTRDRRNFRQLRRTGWRVMRVWEHQVETDTLECVIRIAAMANKKIDFASVKQHYGTMPPIKRRKRLPKP